VEQQLKQHRIVVVGTGNISRLWFPYLLQRDNAQIVALVDRQQDRTQSAMQRWGLDVPTFTALESALGGVDANLVLDLTVPESHPEVSGAAFRHGINVFSEKPLAANMEDAVRLVRAAEEQGLVYSIMQNRRYLTQMMSLRDIIRSGRIGNVAFITSDAFIGLHNGDFRETMDYPLLLDMSVHTWDQSRFLTDMTPTSVTAQSFRPKGSWFAGDTAAVATFEYEDGTIYSYRGHYNAEGASTSFESAWRIVGTKGSAFWDGHAAPYVETAIVPADLSTKVYQHERFTPAASYLGPQGHDGALEEMFTALEAGRPSATNAVDNLKSVGMLHAVMRSLAADGRRVEV
jgi:predicted dehydrogenase